MDAFEYLSVLISIVLGLGITQLLGAFARWLEMRREVRPYAPAILWAAFLLLVHVQTWWAMFGLRLATEWSFLEFAAVLAQPVLLYLMAVLALPGPGSAQRDLREAFFAQRPWFFGLLLGLLALSLLKDLIVAGALPGAANLAFHAALALTGLAALATRRSLAQHLAGVVALALMLAYVGLLFADLA